MPERHPATGSRLFCRACGATSPAVTRFDEPGWVVAACRCGHTKEITTDEAVALRRAALVRDSVLPPSPPLGRPVRAAGTRDDRLRELAFDMWRRGAIDDDAYRRAISRLEG